MIDFYYDNTSQDSRGDKIFINVIFIIVNTQNEIFGLTR
jgi:hypothetical protein